MQAQSYSSAARGSFATTRGSLDHVRVLLRAHCCCELRAAGGVIPSFKKQSDTYRRASHDTPCSLFVGHPGVGKHTLIKPSPCDTKPAASQMVRHVTDGRAPTLRNRFSQDLWVRRYRLVPDSLQRSILLFRPCTAVAYTYVPVA